VEGNYHCLRKEILVRNKEIRGADLHSISESSFTEEGAMCVDYDKLERRVLALAKLIKARSTIRIFSGKEKPEYDTNVDILVEDPKQVFKATGMLPGKELFKSHSSKNESDKREESERRWHFLPSGAVFLALESTQSRMEHAEKVGGILRSAHVTFNGPCFGFGSFKKYPLVVDIGNDGKIDTGRCLSNLEAKQAPYYLLVKNMFDLNAEARQISELFIGLNPSKKVSAIDPMEFQVAGGNVSLALGRNDHMSGPYKPSNPDKGLHIHASVQEATLLVDDLYVIRKGLITEEFESIAE
jgi:hypothetical protein